MKDRINLEAFYPHPPERVWQALTDPDALGSWLLPTKEFKPLIGFRFRFETSDGEISGKVIDVEEGRVLAYTWEDEENEPAKVIWTLEPKDGGTQLRIEHVAIEQPAVTCLMIESYFNIAYALRYNLPGLLRILQGGGTVRPVTVMA